MQKKNHPIFHEEQKFTQIEVWILIFMSIAPLWLLFISQMIFNTPLGNRPASDTMITIFWLLFGVLLPIFFYKLKLITEVRTDGLYIRFTPYHLKNKKINIEKATKYYTRTYSPISEYGGWGIRCGIFGKGRAYNVSGNRGLQIEYKDKKRLLIGTQKPEQLKIAIDQYLKDKEKTPKHI